MTSGASNLVQLSPFEMCESNSLEKGRSVCAFSANRGGDLLSANSVLVADPHPDPPPFRGRE